MELVSILTPTYNHERFIAQCIDSVLAQTYSNWEQIIIDDGSTDKTGEIISKYKDERIKYIRQDNVGIWRLRETYNKALQLSSGTYIALLDGDDCWPSDKLQKQVSVFDKSGTVLSWGKQATVDAAGKIIEVCPSDFMPFRDKTQKEILRKLLFENFIGASTVMCLKDALVSIGGFQQSEYAPYVDYATWLRLSQVGKFVAIEDVMGYWRQHEKQVSATMTIAMAQGHQCAIDFLEQMTSEARNSIDIKVSTLKSHKQRRMARLLVGLGVRAFIQHKWI
jgi:glycosyltransferase involved in cell wall biosynthesis